MFGTEECDGQDDDDAGHCNGDRSDYPWRYSLPLLPM
jgi:hypothetical protein